MGGNKGVVVLLLATVVLSAVFGICSAKPIVVGGSTGWTIPSTASIYPNWASKQKLQVGDVLVFNFAVGAHTVAEVSKANYDSCTSASTLGPVLATAPANITLTKPGTHYFICTITGHCGANQKLTVTTAASNPTPKSSPSPSPSTSPVSAPAPAPAPASAPPPAPASAPAATPPAPTHVALGPGPAGPTTVPGEAPGPAGATPSPPGNYAASSGVSLLSLLSIVAMALVF